jgi:hypothetical protein
MMMMGFMATPCSILWLEEKPRLATVKAANVESFRKVAKEEIELMGWKRDDVKDMLQTLLA